MLHKIAFAKTTAYTIKSNLIYAVGFNQICDMATKICGFASLTIPGQCDKLSHIQRRGATGFAARRGGGARRPAPPERGA